MKKTENEDDLKKLIEQESEQLVFYIEMEEKLRGETNMNDLPAYTKTGGTVKSSRDVVPERIRELCKEARYNSPLEKLQQVLKTTRPRTERIMRGIEEPELDELRTIAAAFQTTTDYLLGITNIRKRKTYFWGIDAIATTMELERTDFYSISQLMKLQRTTQEAIERKLNQFSED